MLKKTIKYTDYNDNEVTEDFYFNLTKAEIMEMELSAEGGLTESLKKIIKTQNNAELVKIFKNIILKAYGERSEDGKRFIKIGQDGRKLSDDFSQTAAYAELFTELATSAEGATEFINGLLPKDARPSEEEVSKLKAELFGEESKQIEENVAKVENTEVVTQ